MAFHADISQTFSAGAVPFFAGMTLDMRSGFGLDAASIAKVAVTGGVPNLIGAPKIRDASDSDVFPQDGHAHHLRHGRPG